MNQFGRSLEVLRDARQKDLAGGLFILGFGAAAYRSRSSRRTAWSVFSSRYLMMMGV